MGKAARIAMFERGSQALANVLPRAAGLYACPLCLLGFSAEEIEDGGRLTEEHAPPDKLGGAVVCLTCADCNHRAGRALDSHMVQAERLIDFAAGRDTPPLRARLGLDGVEQRGRISMENGSVKFFGVPQANSPNTTNAIRSRLEDLVALGDAASGTAFNVIFDESFNERHAQIGWLRSAYLIAFAAFGYRYIVQPCFNVIREQIRNPEVEMFTPPIAVDASASGRRLIFVVNQPTERVGVLIGLGIRSIVLPALIDDGDYLNRAAAMRLSRQRTVELSGSVVEWPGTTQHLLDQP